MDENLVEFSLSLHKLLKSRRCNISKNPLKNIKIIIPIEEIGKELEYLIPCIFMDVENG